MGRTTRPVPSNFYLDEKDFANIRKILNVKKLSINSKIDIMDSLVKYYDDKRYWAERKPSSQNKASIEKAIEKGERVLRSWTPKSIEDFKESLESLDDQITLSLKFKGIKLLDPVKEAKRICEGLNQILPLFSKSPRGRIPNIPLHKLIHNLCTIYEQKTKRKATISFNPYFAGEKEIPLVRMAVRFIILLLIYWGKTPPPGISIIIRL